jgi:hypothetical protein
VHGVLDYWAPTSDGIPAELVSEIDGAAS